MTMLDQAKFSFLQYEKLPSQYPYVGRSDKTEREWRLEEAKVAALIAQAESLAAIAEALQTPDSLFRSRQSDELRDYSADYRGAAP